MKFTRLLFSDVPASKSLHRSCAGRHFYRTENETWAGFGPVCNIEKKNGGRL